MGVLGLYRRTGTISNRYAKYPQDYEFVCDALIDDEFDGHPEITSRRWLCVDRKSSNTRYALAYDRVNGRYKAVFLHNLVWMLMTREFRDKHELDHINRNGLDNRVENLRLVTHQANMYNRETNSRSTTGLKGVDVRKSYRKKGRIAAYVCPHGKKANLGTYDTIHEAAFARDVAADFLYGEFCVLNNVSEDDVPSSRRDEIRDQVSRYLAKHNLTSNILATR